MKGSLVNFVFVLSFILAVAVHELGHAASAKKLGVRIKNISLFGFGKLIFYWRSNYFNGARIGFGLLPYGAYVSLNESDVNKLPTEARDDISFAGPHMNFVMGTLAGCVSMLCYGVADIVLISTAICAALTIRPVKLFALYVILPFLAIYVIGDMLRFESISKSVNEGFIGAPLKGSFFDMQDFPKKFLNTFSLLNAILGVLNLMPIYPLDGGHVAKRFAETRFNKEKLPYKILFMYVPAVTVILMLLPIVGDVKKILTTLLSFIGF